MASPRANTIRQAAVGLACGLCFALAAGCNSKSQPQVGGATSSKAEKARKEMGRP